MAQDMWAKNNPELDITWMRNALRRKKTVCLFSSYGVVLLTNSFIVIIARFRFLTPPELPSPIPGHPYRHFICTWPRFRVEWRGQIFDKESMHVKRANISNSRRPVRAAELYIAKERAKECLEKKAIVARNLQEREKNDLLTFPIVSWAFLSRG